MSNFSIIKPTWPTLFYIIILHKVDKEMWKIYTEYNKDNLYFNVNTERDIKRIVSPENQLVFGTDYYWTLKGTYTHIYIYIHVYDYTNTCRGNDIGKH